MDDDTSSGRTGPTPWFDTGSYIRRARRRADLSQRDLAERLGVSPAAVARLETSVTRPDMAVLEAILHLAGLRLAVLDPTGNEVLPMPRDTLRDNGGRRFPSHLDVTGPDTGVPTDRGVDPRKGLPPARGWYRQRETRDWLLERRSAARPADHPTERSELARARAEAEARRARARAALAANPLPECTCLDECFELACLPACGCQCEPDWRTGERFA